MAEVVGLAASLITLLGLTAKVLDQCKFYIQNVKDAPSDLRVIILECSTLEATLNSLDFLQKYDSQISASVAGLACEGGLLSGCLKSISELEKLVHIDSASRKKQNNVRKGKIDVTLATLAWPFKRDKARKLLDDIQQYKQSINLALTVETVISWWKTLLKTSRKDVKAIKEKTVEIHGLLTESQQHDIHRWLCHTDPSSLHYKAQNNYEQSTCAWVLSLSEWDEWLGAKYRCLLLHGIPGAGKTVLTSYLIEKAQLYCDQQKQIRTACVYYYCYFGRSQDETLPFLRWILSRLCQQSGNIPPSIREMFQSSSTPGTQQLLAAVGDTLENFERAYVFIDAIDESKVRETVVDVLRALASSPLFKKLQLFASSREHSEILKPMQAFSTFISMNNPGLEKDIGVLVDSVLRTNPNFQKWPTDLIRETEIAVSTGARGMFRWAVCQLDLLQRLKWDRTIIKQQLASLPETLYDIYDRIICQISKEDQLFISHVFRWIQYNNDLNWAKCVPYFVLIQAADKSIRKETGHRNNRFYDLEILQRVCGCLIEVNNVYIHHDRPKCDAVSFAHYTVSEYLHSSHLRQSSSSVLEPFKVDVQTSLIELTLLEAHEIASREPWASSKGNPIEKIWAIMEDYNFSSFCVELAISALRRLTREISESEILTNHTISLLDPGKTHFVNFKRALKWVMYEEEEPVDAYLTRELWLLDIDLSLLDTTAAHLFNVVLATNTADVYYQSTDHSSSCEKLYETLIQRYTKQSLFQSRVHFSVFFPDPLLQQSDPLLQHSGSFKEYVVGKEYLFDGSTIEVLAQIAAQYRNNLFNLLLRLGAGYFDPSKILLLYMGGHYGRDGHICNDCCPMNVLLDLGANPNISGYLVSPLQIAVVNRDTKGVEILLKAGADPNGTGEDGGFWWPHPHYMSRFESTQKWSPLYADGKILQNFPDAIPEHVEKSRKITTLLQEHGGQSFSRDPRDTKRLALYRRG